MQKAVFLDRDGVINNDVGHYYIYKPDDFVLNEGLIEVLQLWQQKGYVFVVITNQGGIARGTYQKEDVEKVHNKFLKLMNDYSIKILDIYYCPHHSIVENCLCRKPGSLMIEKAIARYHIDPKKSYLVGDNEKDIQAAAAAGVEGIKIDKNQNLSSIANQIL